MDTTMSARERLAWLLAVGATGAAVWFNSQHVPAPVDEPESGTVSHEVYALPPAEESEATTHEVQDHNLALHHEAGW